MTPMKIKGIPFWEQHLERFVLALAAIALLAFTAMQFVGQPNAATIGGQQVAPSDVDRLLSDRASALADKLRSDAPAPEGSQYQPVLPQFDQRLKESVCPQEKLLVWQPRV